jgi:micrococcal nuclease
MYEYKAIIRRVVDGDTVDVDIDLGFGVIYANQRIRLYGIDTPESRTRDKVEKVFGKMAGAFLKEALGKSCTMQTVMDGKGKFGRILGKFIVHDETTGVDRSVHEIMIRQNLGVEYFGQSKADIEAEHLKNRQILIERLDMDL